MLTTLFIGLFSSAVGTFLGNLALLLLIGKRAEQVEMQRMKQLQAAQELMAKTIKERQDKMKEYVKMES